MFRKSYFVRFVILMAILALLIPHIPKVQAASREEQLHQKIQQIISTIPTTAITDVDKALYLHDYIVKNVAYEMVGDHQTAYGALLDGKAVCAGYADAYLKLLSAVGIEARTITGTAYSESGTPEPHAWTMVIIDGKCLFTDVTWDDPFINGVQDPNYISHDYYNMTLEQISQDHFPDDASKQHLPKHCNHTGYDIYSTLKGEGTGYGIFDDSTTVASAVKYFKYLGVVDGQDAFACEFRFDGTDVSQWAHNNWFEIAKALGLSGSISMRLMTGGHAASITLLGSLVKKVLVSSLTLNTVSVTLTQPFETYQLQVTILPADATDNGVTYVSSDPSVATVSNTGVITAISNGSAAITVISNDGAKSTSCLVMVSIVQSPPPAEPSLPSTTPTETTTQPEPDATEPDPNPTDADPEVTQPVTEPSLPIEPTESTPETVYTEPTEITVPKETDVPTQTQPDEDPVTPVTTYAVIVIVIGAIVIIGATRHKRR